MSTAIPLPERPNLEWLRNRARDLSRESGLSLNQVQFNMATGYGFASWPKLKEYVELNATLTREPDAVGPLPDPIDEFVREACLRYGDDDRTDLASRPTEAIATANVWVAAATASTDALRARRKQASTAGGPFRWEPLMYLCYARVETTEEQVLDSARVLLDAGANPNVGYLWHGLPTPFTALTGVFGNGEGSQPCHPHSQALARLLLERGADPNDGQALYNRMFNPNDEHLELLFEFGLGTGDGGVWKARLGPVAETPAEMLERQMLWAVRHNLAKRIELLDAHGVPNNVAPPTAPLLQAVAFGSVDDVRRLVASGVDVNMRGRGDLFTDEPWETALHTAVEHDNEAMVRLLLDLGADPSIEDTRFHATPKGWCEHFGNDRLAALFP